jgi:hypothetical protein
MPELLDTIARGVKDILPESTRKYDTSPTCGSLSVLKTSAANGPSSRACSWTVLCPSAPVSA